MLGERFVLECVDSNKQYRIRKKMKCSEGWLLGWLWFLCVLFVCFLLVGWFVLVFTYILNNYENKLHMIKL